MPYTVLIPTAGTGSRLGQITRNINKSLVSVAGKPVISHIIQSYPTSTKFVIALGYKGDLVKEYLSLAHPEICFEFVNVYPYEGQGSGLGLSILKCKEHLQRPFIFHSCDTLVTEQIPAPTNDWMAYSESENIQKYRTILLSDATVCAIEEKGVGIQGKSFAYIGVCGIKSFELFWKAMEEGASNAISLGESYAMRSIIEKMPTVGIKMTWHDSGNPEALSKLRAHFEKNDEPNILEKENEAIWFVNGSVIKFCTDNKFILGRVNRARLLHGFVPPIVASTEHMYRYEKEPGVVVSEIATTRLLSSLLNHSHIFWKHAQLTPTEAEAFQHGCYEFYAIKTRERVAQFYTVFKKSDDCIPINDKPMPTLGSLLDALDWKWLAMGFPGRFHGDFHFENILHDKTTGKFMFLDWRQNFSGSLEIGDIYYDFAKLLHGLIINHGVIHKNLYSVTWNTDNIRYDFNRLNSLIECEAYFYDWLSKNGYNLTRVKILTALIFLNIAALHHYPYGLLLYALGKDMLHQQLES